MVHPGERPASTAPPGQLVDIGGYRLNLRSAGKGNPTVVLIPGGGGTSTGWDRVQPEVARFTRVCSYDPAGAGESEPSPAGGSLQQSVNELHRLLLKARIRGSYVLVGQSWGGAVARVYASQHPELVAGMVLVDALHEDAQLGVNGKLMRPRLAPAGEAVAIKTDLELLYSTREGRPHPLGEMPLVVLSRGIAGYPPVEGTTPEEMFADQRRLQADLVQLSGNSKQFIATKSGHAIHRDDPPAVITAIREVVEAIRRHRRLDGAAAKS
jgi:pimeloyl-ACP methyl ester carboxylesterase